MATVVNQLIIDARGAEEGSAAYVRAMRAAQQAADGQLDREAKLQNAIDKTSVTLSRSSGSLSQITRGYNQLVAAVDPVAAAQQKAAKAIEDATLRADAAVRRLGVSQGEAARLLDLFRAKQEAATAEVERATAAANDNSQALARMRAQYDPIFAAQLRHKESLEGISEAERAGAITTELATTARRAALSVMNDTIQKLERVAQAQKDSAQRSVNQQLVVPDRGADIAAYAEAMNKLQAEFDPLFAAEQQYITYMERLDHALAAGAVSQDVYNQRASEAGAALDRASAAASGLATEQQKVTSSTNTAAAAQEHFNSLLGVRTDFGTADRGADIEAYGRALDASRAKYDPLFAAERKHIAALEEISEAERLAGLSATAASQARMAANSTLNDQTQKLERLAQVQKESAQRTVNQQTIVPDRAADIEAYAKSLDELQAKYDPLFAAEQQYKAALLEIGDAERTGALTTDKAAKAVDQATIRYRNQQIEIGKADRALENSTKGVGLNAYAWQNLGYQVNDVVTSLASGISPFQTLAQQGGQIYQILQTGQGGVGGALKAIGQYLMNLSPLVGVFGVLAAGAAFAAVATYKFVAAQRDVELALLGAGRAAGVSGDQIEDIATKASRSSTLTVSAAREIEQAFLKGGKVYGEAFLPGTIAAENFAKASKQDVGEAAKFIADALGNIKGTGLDKLNDESQNFDAATRKTIEDLVNTGKTAEAQTLAITRFGDAFKDASSKALTTSSVLNQLDKAFNNLATSTGRAVSQAFNGAPLQKQIEDLKRARDSATATATVQGETADTSYYDKKIAETTKALDEQTVKLKENTEATRTNREAADTSATKARVAPVADLEALKRDRQILDDERNALERQKSQGLDVPQARFDNNKEALSGVIRAIKDYEAANGAAGISVEKLSRVTAAQEQAIKAVTPAEKAAAAAAMAKAQTFGTVTSETEYNKKATDAYNLSLEAARQATINQNRANDEAAAGAGRLSEALTKNGNSVEFLKARNDALKEASAGTISQDEVEARTKAILTEKIEELRQMKSEEIRSITDETKVRGALADKVQSGAMTAADAARRQELNVKISQLQREADAAQGAQKGELTVALGQLTVATEAQISAEKRMQVLTMSEETDRQIETLQKEADLLGSTNRDRAIALAQLQAEQSLKRQGISITAPESVAYIDKEKLKADLTYAKDQYTRLTQDVSQAIGGIFDDLTQSGKKSFATFADSFSKGFSRIGTRLLEQNVIQPLISGGLDGKGGAGSSFFTNLSNLFDGQKLEKAVSSGSESGIFSGLKSLFGGSKNGASNGGFSMGGLGQGLVAAGVGGSIGYQSQSPTIGALGGAATGFAMGGLAGAAVGGLAGIVGGLFGESQAKKAAKKQLQQEIQARREALDQARPQIEQLALTFEGGSIGNIGKTISDALTQAKQAIKTASDGGDQALADRLMKDYQSYVVRLTSIFSDSFNGTLAEVKAGFGVGGPFSQAIASVQQLGEAIKGFVADSGRLSPAAVAAAQAAAVTGALAALQPPPNLSETQTELARIDGTAVGLTQVLKDLGMSADQAAAAIKDGTNKALDALRDKFSDDLGRKINDAQGKGYLNDAADLIKEVAGLQQDASAIGGDLGQVDTYFTAAAQKLVDGSQLVGGAFNDLIAKFPELQGKVHEYSETASMSADQAAKAAAAALSEIQDRKRGYEDRLVSATLGTQNDLWSKTTVMQRDQEWEQWQEQAKGGKALDELMQTQAAEMAKMLSDYRDAVQERLNGFADRQFDATNDTSTLAGQLAAYDRKANQERIAEIKAGGDAIAALEAAQGAERVKIADDFAKQQTEAINSRLKGYADRYFNATNDSTTLAGQLTAYDRQAQQEREDEAKAGGEALTALEQTQQAERLKIVIDFGKQTADALKQQLSAAQQAFDTFVKNIKAYLDNLRAGSSSPLSPKDRLAAAQSQYNAQLALAQGGDRTALDSITQYSDTLLEASRAYNASGAAYQATYQKILADLDRLPTQVSAEQFIVDAIKDSTDAIVTATKAMQDALLAGVQANSPPLVAQALLQNFQMLDTSVNGLLSPDEFIAGLGPLATADEQRQAKQIFNSIDTNGDGQLSKLELANASSYRVEQITSAGTASSGRVEQYTAATVNTVDEGNGIAAGTKASIDNSALIASQQSQLLASINSLSNSQLAVQQQLVTLNTSIANQNAFVQQNTASTSQYMSGQAQYYSDTYNVQSLMLSNLRSANTKAGAFVYATGGWVNGPGTGTSDSIAARLSNGEFVVNAAAARLNRPLLEAINDNARISLPTVGVPVAQQRDDRALLAELRALRASNERLERQVAVLTDVSESGHLATIGAVKETTSKVADGNATASRRSLARSTKAA